MFSYFFCKLFGIIRVKNFMVIPGEDKKVEIQIKNIPNILLIRDNDNERYYNIIKVVSEIVNDTLIYNWLYVEELKV